MKKTDLVATLASLTLPEEQIRLLSKPTPSEFIFERKGAGGKTFSYVDIGYVTGRLNHIFGSMWSFEVKDKAVEESLGQVWVLGELKVLCSDGKIITKNQFGSSDLKFQKVRVCPECMSQLPYKWNTCQECDVNMNDKEVIRKPLSVGDDLKSATSDSMKKCASMLGLAADVYFPKTWALVEKMRPAIEEKEKSSPEKDAE